MTTFTTSDREDAEKELYKTPIAHCEIGELPQMAIKILEADDCESIAESLRKASEK